MDVAAKVLVFYDPNVVVTTLLLDEKLFLFVHFPLVLLSRALLFELSKHHFRSIREQCFSPLRW